MKELLILSGLSVWIYFIVYVSYLLLEKVDNYLIDREVEKVRKAKERFYKSIEDGVREGVCAFDTYTIVDHNDELLSKGEVKQPTEYERQRSIYVEDKLNDYLNSPVSVKAFKRIFCSENSTKTNWINWENHVDKKREEYGKDFDEL